jgi:hypothetical protein
MIRIVVSVALLVGFLALADYTLTGGSNVAAVRHLAARTF